jgi:hypothetical protein
MSGHSPEQEAATYAGQANMGGVEALERSTFNQVSQIFNTFLFGPASVKVRTTPSSSSSSSSPSPPLSASSPSLAHHLNQHRHRRQHYHQLHRHHRHHQHHHHHIRFITHIQPHPSTSSSLPSFGHGGNGGAAAVACVRSTEDGEKRATHAPTNPIGVTDCLSSSLEKILNAINAEQTILLHQKPGFGKTRTIFKLISTGTFCMIFVPTDVLKKQVYYDHYDCVRGCCVTQRYVYR